MSNMTVTMQDIMEVALEKLRAGGTILLTVKGNSMLPFYKDQKTVVEIGPIDRVLKKYDVVLYKNEKNQWVLHRILKIKENNLITRGDALYHNEIIQEDWIVGKVLNHSNKRRVEERSTYYLFRVCVFVHLYFFKRVFFKIYRCVNKQ